MRKFVRIALRLFAWLVAALFCVVVTVIAAVGNPVVMDVFCLNGFSLQRPADTFSLLTAAADISGLLFQQAHPSFMSGACFSYFRYPPSADILQAAVNGCLRVQSGRERLTRCWCFLGTKTKLTMYPDSSQRPQRSAPTPQGA